MTSILASVDRQLISEEDVFLWLSRWDLKGETESETIAEQDQALQTKYKEKRMLQTERANAESVTNLIREWNTSYQHAQYWQKNIA
jgi:hypothetical protein